MKILITGASGFAGSNLIKYYLQKGYDVTGLCRNAAKISNTTNNCRIIEQDISKRIDINEHFDAIIHTASVRPGKGHDFEAFKRNNLDSMEQLIEFSVGHGVSTFLNFSTRSVYGEIRSLEVTEETDIINPDAYGITKYYSEQLLNECSQINGISFRLPGITGPGAHDTWLVHTVSSFINNETVTVSDFKTRNFVWIFDIARFCEKLMEASLSGELFKNKVVNLACKESANNTELAERMKHRTKSNSQVCVKERADGLFILKADKAFEMGYESHTPMEIVDMYCDTLI